MFFLAYLFNISLRDSTYNNLIHSQHQTDLPSIRLADLFADDNSYYLNTSRLPARCLLPLITRKILLSAATQTYPSVTDKHKPITADFSISIQ